MTAAIGLDPGVSGGAIAIILPNKIILVDLPVLDCELELVELIKPALKYEAIALVEQQGIWTNDIANGAVWNVLKLNLHMQMCVTTLRVLGVETSTVLPAQWKHSIGLTGEGKYSSVDRAIALYPEARHQLVYKPAGARKIKENHNRADALLLAHIAMKGLRAAV